MKMNRRYSVRDYMEAKFYQLPKWLFTGRYAKLLNNNDRIIYAIIRERFSVSLKNGWTDESDNIFFYYRQEEIATGSCLSVRTVQRSISSLKEAGLLDEERTGANLPNRMYLLKPENIIMEKDDDDETDADNKTEKSCSNKTDEAAGNEKSEKEEDTDGKWTRQNDASDDYVKNGYDRLTCPLPENMVADDGYDNLSPPIRQIVTPDTTNCRTSKTELINEKELINNPYQHQYHFEEIENMLKDRINYNRFCSWDMGTEKVIVDEILSIITSEIYLSSGEKDYNIGRADEVIAVRTDTIKSIFNKHLDYSVMLTYIRQFMTRARPVSNPAAYHIAGLYRQCLYRNTKMLSRVSESEEIEEEI